MKKVNGVLFIAVVIVLAVIVGTKLKSEQSTAYLDDDFDVDCTLDKNGNYAYIVGTTDVNKFKVIKIPGNTMVYPAGSPIRYEVKGISSNAFQGYTKLEEIEIPNTVIHIKENAFSGCIKLKNVIFHGSKQQWEKVNIEEGNSELLNADIEFSK